MKQFLGVLPLNDGVNLLVTIHITIAIDSLLVNLTELNNSLVPWVFCVLSSFYTSLTWIIALLGTYKKSISFIKIALNMWALYVIIWLIFMVCAMTDYLESFVCICQRCSESFWLYTNEWHINECVINSKLTSIEKSGDLKENILEYNFAQPIKSEKIDTNIYNFDYVILSSAIVLSFLIFGIFTLLNYLKELKELQCAETCRSELQSAMITPWIS